MEMEIMLGSSQEFYFKVLKVQHWVKDIKNLVESQVDLIWRFLNKKKFVCVPFYPGRGISGAFYSDEIQSWFPSFYTKMQDSTYSRLQILSKLKR